MAEAKRRETEVTCVQAEQPRKSQEHVARESEEYVSGAVAVWRDLFGAKDGESVPLARFRDVVLGVPAFLPTMADFGRAGADVLDVAMQLLVSWPDGVVLPIRWQQFTALFCSRAWYRDEPIPPLDFGRAARWVSEDWFHGIMSGHAAMSYLFEGTTAEYLVRYSESSWKINVFVLATRSERSGWKVKQFRLAQHRIGDPWVSVVDSRNEPTIALLGSNSASATAVSTRFGVHAGNDARLQDVTEESLIGREFFYFLTQSSIRSNETRMAVFDRMDAAAEFAMRLLHVSNFRPAPHDRDWSNDPFAH